MKIGIDFGTTHTTAAAFDGKLLHFVRLDDGNKDPHLLRSMLYITREHETILGLGAVERYLDDNTGRVAQYVEKVVGTIENTVGRIKQSALEPDGPIHIIYDVIIQEDVGAPGRLLQSIKTALRDESYHGTVIYDKFFSVQELIAKLLTHVREQAEWQLGESITEVVLGRPVKFSDDSQTDAFAEQRLREAAELAGFKTVSFLPEPVAAAVFYTRRVDEPKTLLVFDFGGGTLDLTVMRTGEAVPDILATQGVLVGGDDFDSALMRGKVARYFGDGCTMDSEGRPFPSHLVEHLYQWQTIPKLTKANALPIIRKAKRFGNAPRAFGSLESLAMKNYGFSLFERIERAKRVLSYEPDVLLTMREDAIDLSIPITRPEFQGFIGDKLAVVQRGVMAVLEKADLSADDIDVVVTTGGSSLIPIFQQILRRRFPAGEHVHSNTFGSVAAGLAIRAYKEF